MKQLFIVILFLWASLTQATDVVIGNLQQTITWSSNAGNNFVAVFGEPPDTNTILLLHFDGVEDETNYCDSSSYSHLVTREAGTAYITNFSKFGNAIKFNMDGYLKAGYLDPLFDFDVDQS